MSEGGVDAQLCTAIYYVVRDVVWRYARSLLAQGTDLSNLRGTVVDASGAGIPTRKSRRPILLPEFNARHTTSSDGNYEFTGLKSGEYTVSATASGFGTAEVRGVILRPGESSRADARLSVAGTAGR